MFAHWLATLHVEPRATLRYTIQTACNAASVVSRVQPMRRLRVLFWSLLGMLVAVAATVAVVQYRTAAVPARAMNVPPGDQEIAWFNTTTGTATWERFVAGVHHAARQEPRLRIDDSRAFLDQTTAVPEVVLG